MMSSMAAVAPNPQAVAWAKAGLLAIKYGRYRDSAALLTRAVKIDPMLGEAWRWLGALHSGQRQAYCLRWAQRSLPRATIPRLPSVVAAPAPSVRSKAKPQRRRNWRRIARWSSAAALAALLGFGGFQAAYANRVYPGVQAFGQSLSGLTSNEAAHAILPTLQAWNNHHFKVQLGDQTAIVPFNALTSFDPQVIADRALQIGREDSWSERLSNQSLGIVSTIKADGLLLNQQALDNAIQTLAEASDRPAVDAQFQRNPDGTWVVSNDVIGLKLDHAQTKAAFQAAWDAIDWSAAPRDYSVLVVQEGLNPNQKASTLNAMLPKLNQQTAAPLMLTINGMQHQFDRASLLDLSTLPQTGQSFGQNQPAIAALVQELAKTYDQPAQASRLVRNGNRATEWQFGQIGYTLDQAQLQAQIGQALSTANNEALSFSLHETAPPAGELEALGIYQVIGVGASDFSSYPDYNRDRNVEVGGKEFDGLLIAPGEVVSFGGTVGDISLEKGYQIGEMIENGMAVPSIGGGICQVSTTLFRAAFWAGLPIEERHNHSWRLAWYEVDAPPGMDATIALGGPDLKFRNDTNGYILIDVNTDLVNKNQTFTLYGSDTGRTVTMEATGNGWNAFQIFRTISERDGTSRSDRWDSYYTQ
ncbi:VanW family protein [Herpetosiphon giganteus]|uniref:VanW family protein n=1 Tax=Herpetosiphon giganteus TaxID=2029754 RepID=UPI00195E2CBB|nr:VanW family protein [Herpetosiphon giganteus]MBM7844004.1 vancomycin resistance protein YoaR [Herpetosiphon giganteus]